MMRTLGAYLVAVLVTYLGATLFSTLAVMAQLHHMGIAVSWADRASMSLHDIVGMAGLFLPVIAAGLGMALAVAGVLARFAPRGRKLLFTLAGATALVAIHLALRVAFDMTPVALVQLVPGLLLPALAGAVGGYSFVRLQAAASPSHGTRLH